MRSLPGVMLLAVVPSFLVAQGPATAPATPAIVPAPATTLPRTHAPKKTKSDITADDLMTRLYIFADDRCRGATRGRRGT